MSTDLTALLSVSGEALALHHTRAAKDVSLCAKRVYLLLWFARPRRRGSHEWPCWG